MEDIITIFEGRQIKLDLKENQKQDILALKKLWGKQNLTLQADGTLLMQHYVGFVVKNQTRIQILPKIYSVDKSAGHSEDEAQEAMGLLFKLLSYSGFLAVKEVPDPMKISKYNNDMLEIFISIFINRFLKLFNSDVFRQYELLKDNMQFIKGKILFSESLKINSFREHLHFAQYEEFTVNTTLNSIFKTIILRLFCGTKNSDNKKKLKLALVYMEDVDIIHLSKDLFDNMRLNRLNIKYEPLFKMAKMFYYNYQPGFKEGDENTFSFLIPMNKLFEFFIYKMLSETSFMHSGDISSIEYQKPQEYLANCSGSGAFLLKPDISIVQNGKVIIIIDAKYKDPIYQGEVSISQSDVYQMVTYAVHYGCRYIYLVYPAFKGRENEVVLAEYIIPSGIGQISIKVIGVDIMENDIEKVKEQIRGVIV